MGPQLAWEHRRAVSPRDPDSSGILTTVHVLLRSAFHISRLRQRGVARIGVVVDADTGATPAAVLELMRPWRSWLTVDSVTVALATPSDAWFRELEAHGCAAMAVISERTEFIAEAEAAALPMQVVRCDYETTSDRDAALLQEVCHHHYELGGLDEWDGKATQYSPNVLQHLSATNCARYFPHYALAELRERHAEQARPVEALDVGSGPVSRLRWGTLEGLLHVTAVDPLLDMYDVLLAYHGFDRLPAIRVERPIATGAEGLSRYVAPESLEFACCFNTLDHVEDPSLVIEEMSRVLRPGGSLALEFATREGTRQNWHQLHKFDLFLDDEQTRLICQSEGGERTTLVSREGPLAIESVQVASEDYTAVLLRRRQMSVTKQRRRFAFPAGGLASRSA